MPNTPQEVHPLQEEALRVAREQESMRIVFEDLNRIIPAVKKSPAPDKDYWTCSVLLPEGKVFNRHRDYNSEPIVSITAGGGRRIDLVASLSSDTGTPMYKLRKAGGEVLAIYDHFSGTTVTNDSNQAQTDTNGRPLYISQDIIRLLAELSDFIESTPEVSKKSRWVTMLKPRVSTLLKMFKQI